MIAHPVLLPQETGVSVIVKVRGGQISPTAFLGAAID